MQGLVWITAAACRVCPAQWATAHCIFYLRFTKAWLPSACGAACAQSMLREDGRRLDGTARTGPMFVPCAASHTRLIRLWLSARIPCPETVARALPKASPRTSGSASHTHSPVRSPPASP